VKHCEMAIDQFKATFGQSPALSFAPQLAEQCLTIPQAWTRIRFTTLAVKSAWKRWDSACSA
jgi:hypothetical protein